MAKVSIQSQADNYTKVHKRKKRWQKVVTAMAAVVVFCTTYALILPALTWERYLICEVPEHVHDDSCYETVTVDGRTETNLVCRLEEHEHSDACFDVPPAEKSIYFCEKSEHTHGEECYFRDGTLKCTMEEHEHTRACESDPKADVETEEDWALTFADVEFTGDWNKDAAAVAESQLGYTESGLNFEVMPDGTENGYTRYGEWYGIPYGDWDAMFCSFCLNYAGVEDLPFEADCNDWIKALSFDERHPRRPVFYHEADEDEYIPTVGDLIFFDWDELPEEEFADDEIIDLQEEDMPFFLPDEEISEIEYEAEPADAEEPEAPEETGEPEQVYTEEYAPDDMEPDADDSLIFRDEMPDEEPADDENADPQEWDMPFFPLDGEIFGFGYEAEPADAEEPEAPEETGEPEPLYTEEYDPDDMGPDEDDSLIFRDEMPDDEFVGEEPADEEIMDPQEWDMPSFPEEDELPEIERDAEHVGIIAELVYHKRTGELKQIVTIEGDADGQVQYVVYDADDSRILGYAELPENPVDLVSSAIMSSPAADGAVAVISGDLPRNAEAAIEAVVLSEEELAAYFGEERASAMHSFVAYDIRILVDGEEWEPNDSVNVTVELPNIDVPTDGLAVAHIKSDDNSVVSLPSQVDEDGNISFDTDGFSVYVFYLFTVDYYYENMEFHQPGMSTLYLSELFAALEIDCAVEDVVSVTFSDPDLLQVAFDGGDWSLNSLQAFHSAETLTVCFSDGSEIVLNVSDAQTVVLRESGQYELVSTVTDVEDLLEKFNIRSRLASYGVTAATTIKEVTITNSSTTLSAAASGGKGTITCTAGFTGTRTVRVVFNAQQDGDDIACEFTNVSAYIYNNDKLWNYSGGSSGANSPRVIVGSFDKSIVQVSSSTKNWNTTTDQKDRNNAPIGFSGHVITSRGGSNLYPITVDGTEYYLYVATSSTGNFGHQTRQSTPFPCVYGKIPVVAWIEDADHNKVVLPDVCVGNETGSTRWYWKFGGSGRQLIFANDDVSWSNSYGTAVASSRGAYQGIMADENGYYFFTIAGTSTLGTTGSNYDEITVFKFVSLLQVKKTVQDVNGRAVTGGDTRYNFVIRYTPWTSDTPVTEEFTLVNGGTYAVEGYPGTDVRVWEVVDPLYTTSIKNGSAAATTNLTTEQITLSNGKTVSAVRLPTDPEIEASDTVTTIEFINRKKQNDTITKKFTGLTQDQIRELADTFEIEATAGSTTYQLTLKPTAGGGYVVPTSITDNGTTYTWEVPDATEYVISESGEEVEGYTCATTVTGPNGAVPQDEGEDTYTVSLRNGTNKTIEVVNSYTEMTASLTVTKTVNGSDPDTYAAFPVRIKVTGEGSIGDLKQFEDEIESVSVTGVTFLKSDENSDYYDIVEFNIKHGGSFTIPVAPGAKVEIRELRHDGFVVQSGITSIGGVDDPDGMGYSDHCGVEPMPADTVTAAIINTPGTPMPSTGGIGSSPVYMLGVLLLGGALIYLACDRKRRRKEGTN